MEPTAKGDEAQACPDPLAPLGLERPPPSTPIITGEAICLTAGGGAPSQLHLRGQLAAPMGVFQVSP